MLRITVQRMGAADYDTNTEIHTSTVNKNIILDGEFNKHLLDPSRKNGVMDKGKYRKCVSQKKCT